MSVFNIGQNNFSKEVTEEKKTVLIDFWADWCMPCKMLSPVVDEVADEMDDIKVCKVNVDDEPELAQSFQVMSIPTLIVVRNGKVVNTSVGVIPKEKIIELVNQ